MERAVARIVASDPSHQRLRMAARGTLAVGGAVVVVALLARIESLGVDARVLRTVRTGADRNADIIDQAVSSTRARGRSADKERASARSLELGEAVADLHRELLRVSLSQLAE